MASQSSQIYYIVDDRDKEVEYNSDGFGCYQPSGKLYFNEKFLSGGFGPLVTTIDDDPPTSLSLHPDVYGQFYQSPTLDDTAKNYTINATIIGVTIDLDYIAVSAGKETSLLGRTLMVDDMYSGLSFGSGWVTTEKVFNLEANNDFLVFPFQNTTHTTSTPGSMLNFSYTDKQRILFAIFQIHYVLSGSSLSLYGVFGREQNGSYELTSTIDDELPVSNTFYANNFATQLNFLLFSTGEVEAGNHTATFTLSKCVNQTLIVDYIIYKPSFSSLSIIPNLTGLTFPFDVPTAGPNSPTNPSIPTPHNPANSKSHLAALVAGLVADAVAVQAVPALVDQENLEDRNVPVAVVSRSNHRQTLDGPDQMQIATRVQIQEEQIWAMRAELDALARPPDYQST
ncbi:hypothetical protein C8J56DRAFT_1076866 [Mycena floridula]|nr:hypothetical protein C8J56DRAFT_1076866 [Mycena floridula]